MSKLYEKDVENHSTQINTIQTLQDIRELQTSGELKTPRDIARELHILKNVKLIGRILGEPDVFSQSILQEYANLFIFKDFSLEICLRIFLGRFELPGESQKIDRILEAFAVAYYTVNPDNRYCKTKDAVHALAFAVLMLNTDAHNPNIAPQSKMSKTQFIGILKQVVAGTNISDEFLSNIFDSFAKTPLMLIPSIESMKSLNPQYEIEYTFRKPSLGLEIETGFDGRACIVKKLHRMETKSDWKMYLPSVLTPRNSTRNLETKYNSKNNEKLDDTFPTNISGWVIVAVGEDSTLQVGYDVTRYLLKTAGRPVCIRFSDPDYYYQTQLGGSLI